MDSHILFFTRTTYRLLRAEYGVALAGAVLLAVLHLGHIRWPVFVGLFVYIDLVGYLPGAVAYRRARGGPVPTAYYLLYNSMHSLLSAAAVAGLWCVVVGPEWALLALPIHLFGDRAIFGNFLKPLGVSFEPATHPAYQEFVTSYDRLSASSSRSAAGAPAPAATGDRAVVPV
ncbi:MAG: integral rane protein [Blastococcus sp.]|nr:integral rane protein [Blastococcus sp.]